MGPVALPQVAKMALLQDSFGATLCASSPSDLTPMDWAMGTTPGDECWHELMVLELKDAVEFFSEVFHWNIGKDTCLGLWMLKGGEKAFAPFMEGKD